MIDIYIHTQKHTHSETFVTWAISAPARRNDWGAFANAVTVTTNPAHVGFLSEGNKGKLSLFFCCEAGLFVC